MAKDIKSWYQNLLSQKIQIAEWQLDVAAVLYVFVGLGLGLFVALSGVITDVFASVNASVVKDTDTHFSQGTLSSVSVSGTGSGAYLQLNSGASQSGDWYNTDWQYRKKITFNDVTTTNLTNFPVLVKLTSSNFTFANAKSDGGDVRFTDSDGTTLLSYEIEKWDNSGQQAFIWVKIPQVDANSSTDSIYMYYGNAGVSTTQSPTSVWDSNFIMVQHLEEAPANNVAGFLDSTSAGPAGTPVGFAGTASSTTNHSAIANGGVRMDGTDYVRYSNNTAFGNLGTGSYMVEGWVYWNGSAEGDAIVQKGQPFWGDGDVPILFGIDESTSGTAYFSLFDNSGSMSLASNSNPIGRVAANTWTHFVGVRDVSSDTVRLYLNGVQVSSVTDNTTEILSTEQFRFGTNMGGVGTAVVALDEVRVSTVVRSDSWIAATWETVTSPDTFFTYGVEQQGLAPSGTWESPTDSNVIDLLWNEAWGDGTAGSTAFSAAVANVSVNATITFQMRVAQTLGALSGASYATLGTANSGTTFTKTAGDLLLLGLSTDNYRYVQLKATLTSSDGVTNPRLDSMTIYYQKDVDAPEVSPSGISMLRSSGGASVSSGGWTNSPAAYFSWTGGSDSESGLKGYCAYLGTSSSGNPANDKGLLGTSPVSLSDTTCQFIVNATNIDFANSSLRGASWLTTSNSNYYFILKAVDNAGNVSSTSVSFTFKYDDQDPTNPTFVSLPGDFIATKNATMTWPVGDSNEATDANSGVAGLQYRIGNTGTWYGDTHSGTEDITDLLNNDGSYTTDPTTDYPDINEGTNLVYVRTWDVAGNVTDAYVTGALKVNTTAPSAPTSLQVDPTDSTTNEYAFSWAPPAIFSGQVSNITYCYSINTLPSSTSCSFTAAGDTSLAADAYANQPGTNIFYIVARDEASNINYEVYASVEFTYSGSSPSLPLNVEVSDISIKENSSWRLVVSWDTPTSLGAGISRYDVYRSNTNTSCSSNFGAFAKIGSSASTSHTDSGLTQQNYYYCVKACDSANNCSAVSETKSGFPDGKFDVPPELVTQPVVSDITTTKATISWSTSRGADSRIAFGIGSQNYLPEEPSRSSLTTSHSINLINLVPGTTYYFQAKWVDEDGNVGVASERLFTTLPAPTIRDVATGSVGVDSALLRYTATNAASVKIYYGTTTNFGSVLSGGTSATEATYVSQLTALQDGTKYFYRINPIDIEGNEYPGTVLDFTTIARPRISELQVNELTGESQPTFKLDWSTNVETTSAVEYYPESDPSLIKENASAEYKAGAQQRIVRGLTPNTRYVLQLKIRDRLGNEAVSEKFTFLTNADSRPPKITNMRIEGSVVIAGIGGETLPTAQIVISWDTDEPATSQIEYGQGTTGTYTSRSFKDTKLTYNHVVVISKLQPSKVYSLRIVSEDAAANETKSGDSVTITPKAGETATEIVLKNLSDIFGFL